MDSLAVIRPGTFVNIILDRGRACVTDVQISGNSQIRYCIAFWDKGTRKTEWVSDAEIEAKAELPALKIGFKPEQA